MRNILPGKVVAIFALRSPVRPNPIAPSAVTLVSMEGNRLALRGLECVDGTPLIDLKPEFGASSCPAVSPSSL